MLTALIVILVIVIIGGMINANRKYNEQEDVKKMREVVTKPQPKASIHKEYPITGMSSLKIDDTLLGDFNGYALAKKDNSKDPYAIEIHDREGHLFGFLPKGSNELHNKLIQLGGVAEVKGYIGKGTDGNSNLYYGHVSFVADI